MAYATWTDTADFDDVPETIVNDNGLSWRHQGNRDGAGFHEDFYPDNYDEIKSNWKVGRTSTATFSCEFPGGEYLALGFNGYTTDKYVYYQRPTNAPILKSDTFKIGRKFELDTDYTGDMNAAFFGLFNSGNQDEDVNAICQGFVDRKLTLHAHDSAGIGGTATGTTVLQWSTPYWLLIRGNGTGLTLDCYSTQALYDAEGTGDVENLAVAVSLLTGTLTCDRLGWLSHRLAASGSSVRTLEHWVEGDVTNWTPEHQGNKDGIWNDVTYPDNGTTKFGWTWATEGGSSGTYDYLANGNLELDFDKENDVSKRSTFARYTRTILLDAKTAVNDFGFKFQRVSGGDCICAGLAGGVAANQNAIYISVETDGTPVLNVFDNDMTDYNDSGSPGDISNSTDYWVLIRTDGTDIKADIYSTQNLYDAAGAGDVASLSVAISGIASTLLVNFAGFSNKNYELEVDAEKWEIYWTEGSYCNWYLDTGYATALETDLGALQTIFYSDFTLTDTGDTLFDIRKKTTEVGGYSTDSNGGLHYTLAQINALPNANLWGIGFIIWPDPSNTSAAADALSIKHTDVDSTAPPLLGSLDLAAMTGRPELNDAVLMWMQGSDAGSGFWFHALYREDADGGNKKFLKRVVDGSNGIYYAWEDYANFDLDDCFKFFNKDKGASSVDVYDCASRSFLVDAHTAGTVYKIAGVDLAENYSWTTFPDDSAVVTAGDELIDPNGPIYVSDGKGSIIRVA